MTRHPLAAVSVSTLLLGAGPTLHAQCTVGLQPGYGLAQGAPVIAPSGQPGLTSVQRWGDDIFPEILQRMFTDGTRN